MRSNDRLVVAVASAPIAIHQISVIDTHFHHVDRLSQVGIQPVPEHEVCISVPPGFLPLHSIQPQPAGVAKPEPWREIVRFVIGVTLT